jgi:hypothetical protein
MRGRIWLPRSPEPLLNPQSLRLLRGSQPLLHGCDGGLVVEAAGIRRLTTIAQGSSCLHLNLCALFLRTRHAPIYVKSCSRCSMSRQVEESKAERGRASPAQSNVGSSASGGVVDAVNLQPTMVPRRKYAKTLRLTSDQLVRSTKSTYRLNVDHGLFPHRKRSISNLARTASPFHYLPLARLHAPPVFSCGTRQIISLFPILTAQSPSAPCSFCVWIL